MGIHQRHSPSSVGNGNSGCGGGFGSGGGISGGESYGDRRIVSGGSQVLFASEILVRIVVPPSLCPSFTHDYDYLSLNVFFSAGLLPGVIFSCSSWGGWR